LLGAVYSVVLSLAKLTATGGDASKAWLTFQEDFERMRDLGCDTIQGYLFGKPLAYDRANDMVVGLGAKRLAG
jgi:predicted signal transduction protein with EAL and GGDEF domain